MFTEPTNIDAAGRGPEPGFQLNREPDGSGEIGPAPRNIPLRARRPKAGADGWLLRICAETGLTDAMRGQIETLDRRSPTIGFERLIAIRTDDIGARLDLLTRLATSR